MLHWLFTTWIYLLQFSWSARIETIDTSTWNVMSFDFMAGSCRDDLCLDLMLSDKQEMFHFYIISHFVSEGVPVCKWRFSHFRAKLQNVLPPLCVCVSVCTHTCLSHAAASLQEKTVWWIRAASRRQVAFCPCHLWLRAQTKCWL